MLDASNMIVISQSIFKTNNFLPSARSMKYQSFFTLYLYLQYLNYFCLTNQFCQTILVFEHRSKAGFCKNDSKSLIGQKFLFFRKNNFFISSWYTQGSRQPGRIRFNCSSFTSGAGACERNKNKKTETNTFVSMFFS